MRRTIARMRVAGFLAAALAVLLAWSPPVLGQAGFEDDRVMLQGFYWESYRHGHPQKFPGFGNKRWYEVVREQAATIRSGRFDLIWLPPPSYAGAHSAGYNPKQYHRLDNSYGTFAQHRAMLEALLRAGVEPVADVVINHRDGTNGWTDFKNPDWGLWAICREDEAFSNAASGVAGAPVEQRGGPEELAGEYRRHGGGTYPYKDFRDLDHTNPQVRRDVVRYLRQLRSLGYRGWRYDMVHGFHARWVALYNRLSEPTFSVGEYDWAAHNETRGWIWHTATTAGDLRTASCAFDFTTHSTLKTNKGTGRYFAWYGFGSGIGLVGDTTDGQAWKDRAVTFVENHDTGYRTNEDGAPQDDHRFDSFANTWEVEQAYAHVLTHPGVPCVYWKHYFDWGEDLRTRIDALLNARKVAGVHSGSTLHPQDNARQRGVYAAMIEGRAGGRLYVRIGGSDEEWQPHVSGYRDYREYARGAGWKVWVSLPGNPDVQQAPRRGPLPVPEYTVPDQIDVPEDV